VATAGPLERPCSTNSVEKPGATDFFNKIGRLRPLGRMQQPGRARWAEINPNAVVRGRNQLGHLLLCSAWLATASDIALSGTFIETRQIVRNRVPRCHRSSEDVVVGAAARIVVQRAEGDNRNVASRVQSRHT
jgi:hypothetical protein